METETGAPLDIKSLALPDEWLAWIDGAAVYESSGHSGAKTVYIDRDGGVYLKISARGSLSHAAQMQAYFADKKMSSPVLRYHSADRDYLLTAAVPGEDGTTESYLADPERLSTVFGESLRALHAVDFADCPVKDRMSGLVRAAAHTPFIQSHLTDISDYIGTAQADTAAAEIASNAALLKNDVLIHGDYCLPNILLRHWEFSGFIDVADGGAGDRHYDLAWGLWTLHWNLKTPKYGQCFLDAYGWDEIDRDRLRICGLLAGME